MRIIKHARVGAAAAGTALIAAIALWPEALVVDVVPVVKGPIQVTIDEDGLTRVRQRFVVSAPVSGRLQRVELEPGDVVRRDMVVARLLPADAPLLDARIRAELAAGAEAAKAALERAAAEQKRARATQERARTFLRRQQELLRAGAASLDDVDAAAATTMNAEAAMQAADAAADGARHDLELARARLQAPRSGGRAVDVTAPSHGVVLRRLRESESVVAAGEPLLELGDPADLEIVVDVLSTDALKIPPRAAALVGGWGESEPLRGYVRRIEPSGFVKLSSLGIEEQRVNVIIALDEPPPNMGDGYRIDVQILLWAADEAVKVPIGSLFRHGDEWAVFVVDEGRARLRQVRIGQRNANEAQVLAGVAAGDPVVLYPPDTLTDGGRVTAAQP